MAGTRLCSRSGIRGPARDSPQMQKELFTCVHQDCFLLGKPSSQVLPRTCCVLLPARYLWFSISETAAQLVLLNFHFLGQSLHPPFSLPWCPAVQPGWEWAVEVSHRLKQIGSVLDALPAHPAIYPSPGGCAVRVTRRVLQSVFLSLACEIHQCC